MAGLSSLDRKSGLSEGEKALLVDAADSNDDDNLDYEEFI